MSTRTLLRPLVFPPGFWWGTASAGHQVEGGNVHSDWWAWEQEGLVRDGTRSGRACDYWRRYREDHETMRALGFGAIRTGVEWARTEPRPGYVDPEALAHYREILEDQRRNGLRVCLTLHHWVIPQWLAEEGGWLSHRALSLWRHHVERIVRALGDLVDLWITLNEPMVPVLAGYVAGVHPPCRRSLTQAARVFARLLHAHAIAYHAIHAGLDRAPGGEPVRVGFAGAYQDIVPYHETGWRHLAERPLAAFLARASFGAWDRSVRTGRVAWPWGVGARVPGLAGSHDFVGVNFYTRVSARLSWQALRSLERIGDTTPPGIERTEMGWQVHPPSFFDVLARVWQEHGKPIWITENGCAEDGDEMRRRYLLSHLAQVHRAIAAGCDIRGYLHWTFSDNFEWREGFAKRFGLFAMDHDDPELRRTPRQSAAMLGEIARANAIAPELVARHAPGALGPWPLAPGYRAIAAS